MNVSAFIPIKKFSTSKKRLSNIISFAEREALAASMAKHTIDILSKSKNSIFENSKLRGVVYGTINKNKLSIHK